MASGKVLGMSLGMLLVVVLFVLPLKFVRGLIEKIPKVGTPIANLLHSLGVVARLIPVGAVKDLYA